MIKLDLIQGTDEWREHRMKALNASDAPTIMGAGYIGVSEHLEIISGMKERTISDFQQQLFDRGHAAEAAQRPLVERLYDVTLVPVVAMERVQGVTLSASFDGFDEKQGFLWEHKLVNDYFRALYKSEDKLGPRYYWQLEHQMMVAGVDKAMLTASEDGERYDFVYESVPERREALIQGWKDFLDKRESFERTDEAWVEAAKHYRLCKELADYWSGMTKEANSILQGLAGNAPASGAGVRVSVSEKWEERMTPAAYIKEQKIKLPTVKLEAPKYSYRTTLTKEESK